MSLDGFFIKNLVDEISVSLTHSRVEKITQVSDCEWVFQFYYKGQKNNLFFDLSPSLNRLFLTQNSYAIIQPTQFTNNLKKHLEGSILNNIHQYKNDRVIVFDFTYYDFIYGPIKKNLIVELMGKHANFFLIQNDVIVDCFKRMFFETGRQSIPKAIFEFFPTDKKVWDNNLESTFDFDTLMQYMGMSKKLALYISENQINIKTVPINPTLNLNKMTFYWFNYFDHSESTESFSSLSKLQESIKKITTDKKAKPLIFIESTLKKQYKKLNLLELELEENSNNTIYKTYGDLIYSSGYDLKSKLSEIIIEDEKILLDSQKSLNDNAQNFYKIYQKNKRKTIHLEDQITHTKSLINIFEDFKLSYEISDPKDLTDLEKDLESYGYFKIKTGHKNKNELPKVIKINFNGVPIYIGKNSTQNAYLTHKIAESNDYFFHVKNGGGAHVIVKSNNLDEPLLRISAMLAAYFSSQKYSSSIPVDYTLIKNVKKIPGMTHSFVTLKNHKTMYIDIDDKVINDLMHKN